MKPSRLIKNKSVKKGLHPGSLIHIGEQKLDKARIRVIDYDERNLNEHEYDTIEECFSYGDTSTVTWINIDGLHDVELIKKLGGNFGVHNLVLEDILDTDHRPRIEVYGDYMYEVLKMLYFDEEQHIIIAEQLSILLFDNTVITFQERVGDTFEPVRERIRNSRGRIRQSGADFLAYALVDAVVDNYFFILEKLGESMEVLEEELLNDSSKRTLRKIHAFKRELVLLRKWIVPVRELVTEYERNESDLVEESTAFYLRDLYGHIVQLIDTMEAYRDMVSGMLDTYISMESNRMNEVMKTLTIMASIFIPLTFIAGIYGMNFENMPELHHSLGYPAVVIIMLAVAGGMVYYFKKKDWL